MEITIGIRQVARELTFESTLSADEVVAKVEEGLKGSYLDLTDARGRRIIVPSDAVGYLEIGAEEARPVGFGRLGA